MIFERDRLAVGKARYSLQNAGTFKEEDHPRGEGGQFGTGGGEEKKERKPGKAKTKGVSPKEYERLKGLADMYGRYTKAENPNQDKNLQSIVGRPDLSDQQVYGLYQIFRRAK